MTNDTRHHLMMTPCQRCFRQSMTHLHHKPLNIKGNLFVCCLFNNAVSSYEWEDDFEIMTFERIFIYIKTFAYKSKEFSCD
jgi:hypothetical protein